MNEKSRGMKTIDLLYPRGNVHKEIEYYEARMMVKLELKHVTTRRIAKTFARLMDNPRPQKQRKTLSHQEKRYRAIVRKLKADESKGIINLFPV
jgi:hypothetical protein